VDGSIVVHNHFVDRMVDHIENRMVVGHNLVGHRVDHTENRMVVDHRMVCIGNRILVGLGNLLGCILLFFF